MGIKVGTAPVSWGIMEVEGWSGQQAYREVLDEMAQAGYAGTELGPYGYLPTEPERVTEELSARGLSLVSSFVPIPLEEPEHHEASFQEAMTVAKLLAQAGARLIVLAGDMKSARMAVAGRVVEERDSMSDEQWESATRMLMRLATSCRELGLDTVFH